jgi:hypothetical protein
MRLRLIPGLFVIRRLVHELQGIREQITKQTDILTRLAAQVAPQLPPVDRAEVAAETGVSYVDTADQAIAQEYILRTERDTGRPPTDDEVMSYLADEKTVDLHERLIQRDREIDRLSQERHR